MQAVILAAGAGSRLRRNAGDPPKPLQKLLGLSLLERAVRCARSAGCEDILVVTGYAGAEVQAACRALDVRFVHAEAWERGNGASLLAAAPALAQAPFLLLMADHVLDPALCREAVAQADRAASGALLLVDPRLDRVHDLEEATKVRLEGDRIVAIGKTLTAFNAVDVGVFIGTPVLLETLAELAEQADDVTLSAAAARLAEKGRLTGHRIRTGWWVDVDDAEAMAVARTRLLEAAGASGGDGPIARWLNRPLSRRITALIAPTRITPDGVTWLAFALAALGAVGFAFGLPLLGGLLAQCASIVDGCDGELARLRLASRPQGALLDTMLDRYADSLLIGGLLLGAVAQAQPATAAVAAALAAAAGAPLSALMKDRMQALWRERRGNRRYNPLQDDPVWLRLLPANRDGRMLLILLAGLAGRPLWALIALALVTHVAAIGRLVHALRDA